MSPHEGEAGLRSCQMKGDIKIAAPTQRSSAVVNGPTSPVMPRPKIRFDEKNTGARRKSVQS